MKVRCITLGLSVDSIITLRDLLDEEYSILLDLKSHLEVSGPKDSLFQVQTVRVCTNPFEEWLYNESMNEDTFLANLNELNSVIEEFQIAFFSIGPAKTTAAIKKIPFILKNCPIVSSSVRMPPITDDSYADFAEATTSIVKEISEDPLGNFRFCATFNCSSGIPFFPVSYNRSDDEFSIITLGLECSSLLVKACHSNLQSPTYAEASEELQKVLDNAVVPVENKVIDFLSKHSRRIDYGGIDTSMNPSLCEEESMVLAYENVIGVNNFGSAGTLGFCSLITKCVKSIPVKQTGYCGLMLPVMEDILLAKRGIDSKYKIGDLVMFSSVCGVGIDTVPIAGGQYFNAKGLQKLYADISALAFRLDKPLTCRVLPLKDLKPGDMTNVDSPYLTNTKVFDI